METLSSIGINIIDSPFRRLSPVPSPRIPLPNRGIAVFAAKTSSRPVSEVEEDEVLQTFLKDRALNGDFISKTFDMLWWRELVKSIEDAAAREAAENVQENDQVMRSDYSGGFLKLSSTREWVLGDSPPPVNRRPSAKEFQDDREWRRKLNLLHYKALKRELMFLSIGIGTACSVFCVVTLSLQAAVSYAVGVLFSCLYLQLLCGHVDNLSKQMVPSVFMPKKRRETESSDEIDLTETLEKAFRGTGIALSSPRLVIPAAIYGLWILSHRYLANDFFELQLVPAMVGLFAYKAAALVQVYRDNDDVQFIFPKGGESE